MTTHFSRCRSELGEAATRRIIVRAAEQMDTPSGEYVRKTAARFDNWKFAYKKAAVDKFYIQDMGPKKALELMACLGVFLNEMAEQGRLYEQAKRDEWERRNIECARRRYPQAWMGR